MKPKFFFSFQKNFHFSLIQKISGPPSFPKFFFINYKSPRIFFYISVHPNIYYNNTTVIIICFPKTHVVSYSPKKSKIKRYFDSGIKENEYYLDVHNKISKNMKIKVMIDSGYGISDF